MKPYYQSRFPSRHALSFVAALLSCGMVHADPVSLGQDGSIYAGGSSFGATVGYGQRLSDSWAARVMINSGGRSGTEKDKNIGDNHYDVKAKIGPGATLLADFYPITGSGFRLSGGMNISRIKGELSGRSDGAGGYNINGHRYSSTEVGSLTAQIKFNTVKPYLGIGWESKALGEKGWRFVSDLGFIYCGKGKATLDATGAAGNAALQRDLASERKDLQKQGAAIVVGLGAAYAF
ncbi:MAG: hypothetical protein IPO35_10785 [Uliginosibacterium sp.]|nr:hypothetical protein [Uliginosibacterium sp.]MBK9615970.1 hypothetical protein [Uliginosibacterium sp.]